MNHNKFKCIIVCALLTSCASLQQAPLIYSSKSTVGLDLSSSTTESPGASISIGVKLVDAAYVPVAVSKRIGQNRHADANKEIQRIEAIFGEGITQGSLEALTEENKRKIIDYLNAKLKEEALAAQISDLDKQKDGMNSSIIELERRIQEVNLQPSTPDENIDKPQTINQLEKEIVSAKSKIKKIESEINELKPNYASAIKTSSDLFEEASRAASFLRTDKRDALSVYGRFSSRSTAETSGPKAGLAAGKIFSTGVASQNLTEAARYEAVYEGLAGCLKNILELYKEIAPENRPSAIAMTRICDPVYLKQLESSESK